jgi:hypothetical protein
MLRWLYEQEDRGDPPVSWTDFVELHPSHLLDDDSGRSAGRWLCLVLPGGRLHQVRQPQARARVLLPVVRVPRVLTPAVFVRLVPDPQPNQEVRLSGLTASSRTNDRNSSSGPGGPSCAAGPLRIEEVERAAAAGQLRVQGLLIQPGGGAGRDEHAHVALDVDFVCRVRPGSQAHHQRAGADVEDQRRPEPSGRFAPSTRDRISVAASSLHVNMPASSRFDVTPTVVPVPIGSVRTHGGTPFRRPDRWGIVSTLRWRLIQLFSIKIRIADRGGAGHQCW